MKQLIVEPIAFKDVRGKELLYLKITGPKTKGEVLINIGEKTHKAVKELIDKEEGITKIQFETPTTQGNDFGKIVNK